MSTKGRPVSHPLLHLSVIVPMFNAAPYIVNCLGSLLAAHAPGVEIIVVDDGSTDGCGDTVRTHFGAALADGRLRLMTQPNAGVSAARNTGLSAAGGRYLAFVDADDAVTGDYFRVLLDEIASSACDIIEFGFSDWSGALPAVAGTGVHSITAFGRFTRSRIEREVFGHAMWYPWSRIYRAALFDGLRFPPGVRFCEDMMTISQVYRRAGSVSSIADVIYLYRRNPQGATLTVRPDYVSQLIAFYQGIAPEKGDTAALLKMSTQYAIFSCNRALDTKVPVPAAVRADMLAARLHFGLYRYIEARRRWILWFPRTYLALWRAKNALLSNRSRTP